MCRSDVSAVYLFSRRAEVQIALDDHRDQPARSSRLVRLARLPYGRLPDSDEVLGQVRTRHLRLPGEDDEKLASLGRVPPDHATWSQPDGDEVRVRADPEGADGETFAAMGVDGTMRQV